MMVAGGRRSNEKRQQKFKGVVLLTQGDEGRNFVGDVPASTGGFWEGCLLTQ